MASLAVGLRVSVDGDNVSIMEFVAEFLSLQAKVHAAGGEWIGHGIDVRLDPVPEPAPGEESHADPFPADDAL